MRAFQRTEPQQLTVAAWDTVISILWHNSVIFPYCGTMRHYHNFSSSFRGDTMLICPLSLPNTPHQAAQHHSAACSEHMHIRCCHLPPTVDRELWCMQTMTIIAVQSNLDIELVHLLTEWVHRLRELQTIAEPPCSINQRAYGRKGNTTMTSDNKLGKQPK